MKTILILISTFSLIQSESFAKPAVHANSKKTESVSPVKSSETSDPLTASTDTFLKAYVIPIGEHQSKVDYAKMKAHSSELNQLVLEYEKVSLANFKSFSKSKQIAFLINAYNILTFKLIVDNYPVKSIRNIGGVFASNFTNQWKTKFFKILDGKAEALDTIEQDILRKEYQENRIHSALVCASKSCPPIRNEAYTEAKLDEQLNDQMKKFVRDADRNFFNEQTTVLTLSMIFKWYQADFGGNEESVKKFIAKVMSDDPAVQSRIADPITRVRYFDYDWSLNGKD